MQRGVQMIKKQKMMKGLTMYEVLISVIILAFVAGTVVIAGFKTIAAANEMTTARIFQQVVETDIEQIKHFGVKPEDMIGKCLVYQTDDYYIEVIRDVTDTEYLSERKLQKVAYKTSNSQINKQVEVYIYAEK